ncbi:MAG: family 1 glycosylhydrolase [Actinomycetota bacterium]|nr:family 1 glycosylhydrolase [Actinomycetota bacterium]
MGIEFVGAFESTYQPAHDVDVAESTGHAAAWADDLELLRGCGVRRLRYPIRWHRVEASPGEYDWAATDAALGFLADREMTPIVDLVHHTSYPRWLTGGFADPRFSDAYLRYCEAFARRYRDTVAYTLFNEPFATLFLAGCEGLWPPYHRGTEAFVAMLRNVLPAFGEAVRLYRDLLPGAAHVYVDTCERHSDDGSDAGSQYAAFANDRRFFVLDAMLGRPFTPDRPFVAAVVAAGGEDLLDLEPAPVDVLGLDYYAHSQWHFAAEAGVTPSPVPRTLAALIVEYWERYQTPCMLSETNIRGFPSDRATWLKYTLEQCELAQEAGVALDGYCWFPFVDSCDWDSLLYYCDGNVDPVGVYWLDDTLARRPSSMSRAYAAAAAGASAADLPAYLLRPPVSQWLAGYAEQMSHWDWQPPPADERHREDVDVDVVFELRIRDALQ